MSELFREDNTREDYQRAGIKLEIANIDISDLYDKKIITKDDLERLRNKYINKIGDLLLVESRYMRDYIDYSKLEKIQEYFRNLNCTIFDKKVYRESQNRNVLEEDIYDYSDVANKTTIYELNQQKVLSKQAVDKLVNNGVFYLDDILKLTNEELCNCIGKNAYNKILGYLDENNLKLLEQKIDISEYQKDQLSREYYSIYREITPESFGKNDLRIYWPKYINKENVLDSIEIMYNTYMDIFDRKLGYDQAYDELKHLPYVSYEIGSFAASLKFKFFKYFGRYAKEVYGIDNLEEYVSNKKLFKDSYELFMKYKNNEITIKEYAEKVEQMNFEDYDIRGDGSKVFDYLADDSRKSSFCAVASYYAKNVKKEQDILHNADFRSHTLSLIENLTDEKEIFDIVNQYASYRSISISNTIKNAERFTDHFVVTYIDNNYKNLTEEERKLKIITLLEKIDKVIDTYNINKVEYKEKEKQEKIEAKNLERSNYLKSIYDESILIVNNFMQENLSIKDFVKNSGITDQQFEEALESVKEFNNDFYMKYVDYMDKKSKQSYAVILKRAKVTADEIMHGLTNPETNQTREYDILDYYMRNSMDLDMFVNFVNSSKDKFSDKEYRAIVQFSNKNYNQKDERKIIYESKMIIGGVEITPEMKKEVIKYLTDIHAPYNLKIFKIALRRKLAGVLEDENSVKDSNTRVK